MPMPCSNHAVLLKVTTRPSLDGRAVNAVWLVPIEFLRPIHTHSIPFPCLAHAVPLPCRAVPLSVSNVSLPFDLHSAAVSDSHLPCHAHTMLRPCTARPYLDGRAVLWPWEQRHGRIMTWAWRGKCESDTAALCKSNEKDTFYTFSGTAWQGNGMICVNRPLKSLSILIPRWRVLTVPCSDAMRHRENSAAVIQTQNLRQHVVLTPLLSLPAFYDWSLKVNTLSLRHMCICYVLTALSRKEMLQQFFIHIRKFNLFFN